MRQLIIILFLICITSCSETKKTNPVKATPETAKPVIQEEPTEIVVEDFQREKEIFYQKLEEARQVYADDSLALEQFYLKRYPPKTKEDFIKKAQRLENLLAQSTIDQYLSVNAELKPLLLETIDAKFISPEQALRFQELYAIYDDLRSETLFRELISEDENYQLVWNTIKMIVKKTRDDTVYLHTLILLDEGISTNVELSQTMQEFLPEGIMNNPEGFLNMYALRTEQEKRQFALYATRWEDPIPELMKVFDSLSQTPKYDSVATDLINDINELTGN